MAGSSYPHSKVDISPFAQDPGGFLAGVPDAHFVRHIVANPLLTIVISPAATKDRKCDLLSSDKLHVPL
jgi:hypothetical protein